MSEKEKKSKTLDEEYFVEPLAEDAFYTDSQDVLDTKINDDIYDTRPESDVKLGMKWYKFLIYFLLWAGAILNFLNAIAMLTGSIYEAEGVPAHTVYDVFPELKSIDLIFGILLIALSIYQIVVRFALAKFKHNAHSMLKQMYICSICWEMLYAILVTNAIGSSVIIEALVSSAVRFVIILIDEKYFKNRAHLFTNK